MRQTRAIHLVVVGDVLLDRDIDGEADRLAPDAPVPVVRDPRETMRPGGAGLAAVLAASDGAEVSLVAPIADDAAGHQVRALLERAGVQVRALPTDGATGEKTRIYARGQPVTRLDRGGDITAPVSAVGLAETLALADAVLVADYGRGMAADGRVRRALQEVAAAGTPMVWDPHPRGAPPVRGSSVATPNQAEARAFATLADARPTAVVTAAGNTEIVLDPRAILTSDHARAAASADALRQRWRVPSVCVTLGPRGAVLVGAGGTPMAVPAASLGAVVDSCGAGDRFASAAAIALGAGALLSEAIIAAVQQATDFVAAGGAAAFAHRLESEEHGFAAGAVRSHGPVRGGIDDPTVIGAAEATAVVARVRSTGGTVVATGGCFDILHAGHVQLLAAARGLGDALIVCLNSDASVRRLKGSPRPINTASDRAAVLRSLACVDAVAVFCESTPEAILNTLRPDLWVKGADYTIGDIPEAPLLASWGGRALVLPYLPGRSTTTIIEEVHHAR